MGACKTPIPTFVLFVIIYEKYPNLDEKNIQVKLTDAKGRKGQKNIPVTGAGPKRYIFLDRQRERT